MAEKTSTERNREAWLTDCVSLVLPRIRETTGLAPLKPIKVSVGFPASGGKRRRNGKITAGQCCMTEHNKFQHIFIHPMYDQSRVVEMVGTVMHEVLHACLPMHTGHRKDFSQAGKKLGLAGKPTAMGLQRGEDDSETTQALIAFVNEVVEQLGAYPHESLEVSGKIQGTRLLKASCSACGYVVRVTRVWLDGAGAPICPQCLIQMEEGGEATDIENPLTVANQVVEYKIKPSAEAVKDAHKRGIKLRYDPRYSIQMNRTGRDLTWWIIDFGPSEHNGVAVLGTVQPRLVTAESRDDAIAVVQALQTGAMTWEELEVNDDDPALEDVDEFEPEETEESDDEPFTEAEMVLYEQQERERELGRPKIEPKLMVSFDERVKALEGLFNNLS